MWVMQCNDHSSFAEFHLLSRVLSGKNSGLKGPAISYKDMCTICKDLLPNLNACNALFMKTKISRLKRNW